VTIQADRIFTQMDAEKKVKCKRLCIEVQRIWNLKYKIAPSNNSNHRRNNKYLRKHLEAIPEKHSINSLQNAAVLGISHVM
jgi:hypothetical protein